MFLLLSADAVTSLLIAELALTFGWIYTAAANAGGVSLGPWKGLHLSSRNSRT